MVKAEGDYTQKLVEQCMQELVHDFQDWYGRLHALNHADWQMCSQKFAFNAHCNDAKAANVTSWLHMGNDMCLLIMCSTYPSMSYFDSTMFSLAVGHLVVFIACSITRCNMVKYEICRAATVPLLMLLSVLMPKHQGSLDKNGTHMHVPNNTLICRA